MDESFIDYCQNGNLEMYKKIYEKTNFDINKNLNYFFKVACSNGHLNLAQWLLTLNINSDIHYDKNLFFKLACSNGHLHIAKWLYSINENIDIRIYNDTCFKSACYYNYIEIIKWLAELCSDYKLEITDKDNKHIIGWHIKSWKIIDSQSNDKEIKINYNEDDNIVYI